MLLKEPWQPWDKSVFDWLTDCLIDLFHLLSDLYRCFVGSSAGQRVFKNRKFLVPTRNQILAIHSICSLMNVLIWLMRGVYALLWMRNGAGIDDDPHWNRLGYITASGARSLQTTSLQRAATFVNYSRTPLIQINWDGELSGYAENPDNWNFLSKQAKMAVLKFGCYYVKYVLASKPFDYAWFEVLEDINTVLYLIR